MSLSTTKIQNLFLQKHSKNYSKIIEKYTLIEYKRCNNGVTLGKMRKLKLLINC